MREDICGSRLAASAGWVEGDEILGFVKILKKTKTMVFVICHLQCNNKIVASASGVWKIPKAPL